MSLDEASWVDLAEGWMAGADELFAYLVGSVTWDCPEVVMWGNRLDQPRLSASLDLDDYRVPEAIRRAATTLTEGYGRVFDSVGVSLYRDGADSVAWHGDRIAREISRPVVALVSLGHRRPLLLRPAGGGPSRRFELGRGDLLVMGGECQRAWQHTVPKVARAGPRISLAFRHSA